MIDTVFWLAAPTAILMHVVYTDLRYRRIGNESVAALGLIFVLGCLLSGPPDDVTGRMVAAAVVFGLCFLAFAARLLGGGDVKLLPVVFLFIPVDGVAAFVLALSAFVVVTFTVLKMARPHVGRMMPDWAGITVPGRYAMGPTIALSFIFYKYIGIFARSVVQSYPG
ncbi:prepilin peptidase [Sulfitobacter albidus]|uniref:Prepilin peptidase n=1 Tax=Sulfitobacter albidus TaxID=2829501 RepID=A0A975JET5_9RHOB|nr:prepilin peptidase [Sulfitobacter albidus]QUJ76710.1 prepilin peptidase [Sulfitobacter albidus]